MKANAKKLANCNGEKVVIAGDFNCRIDRSYNAKESELVERLSGIESQLKRRLSMRNICAG